MISMLSYRAISRLAISRLLEFCREPTALFWVFGFPLIMLIVLGVTFTDRPPETLHVDFLDPSGSSVGERLRGALLQDERIVLAEPSDDPLRRLQRVGTSLVIVLNDVARLPISSCDFISIW